MKYFHDWADRDAVAAAFADWTARRGAALATFVAETSFPTDDEILLAAYTYEDYSGSAYVLFERDGKLYEVVGGHCSCNGLEGQWEPEETSWEAIKMGNRLPQYAFGPETRARLAQLIEERAA